MAKIKRVFRVGMLMLISTILIVPNADAQNKTMEAEEKRLYDLYQDLYDNKLKPGSGSKVEQLHEKFKKEFIEFLKNNPASAKYEFKTLSKWLDIKTSENGQFRVYTWDDMMGGTMRYYETLVQWNSGKKSSVMSFSNSSKKPRGYVSDVFTVKIKGVNHYFFISNAIYSAKDRMQTIQAYKIVNGELQAVENIFKAKDKHYTTIEVEYELYPESKLKAERSTLMRYDARKQIIHIPLVDKDYNLTYRDILYKLKGDKFVFIGFTK